MSLSCATTRTYTIKSFVTIGGPIRPQKNPVLPTQQNCSSPNNILFCRHCRRGINSAVLNRPQCALGHGISGTLMTNFPFGSAHYSRKSARSRKNHFDFGEFIPPTHHLTVCKNNIINCNVGTQRVFPPSVQTHSKETYGYPKIALTSAFAVTITILIEFGVCKLFFYTVTLRWLSTYSSYWL